MSLPASTLPIGFRIAGRYEVVGVLGTGGQASVYRVRDHHLQEDAALKLLTAPSGTGGIWSEAEYLRRLEGRFLLPVLNADIASGAPYIVTAIAAHGTVDDYVVPDVGTGTPDAVRWARQTCRGLARMHDLGLVHNDVKPANLFLDKHRDALVGDLGYAQLLDLAGTATVTGVTPQTTAPEIASAAVARTIGSPGVRPSSVLSDVYSVGATLWWMLAGRPPYVGSFDATLKEVAKNAPHRLMDAAPQLGQGLCAVVEKAMSRSPSDRYQSVADVDRALGELRPRARPWERVAPHAGHEQCFRGQKGSSVLLACVSTGTAKKQIAISHEGSGRRYGSPISVRAPDLPRRLRAVFRDKQ